ncbi:hypothetical protein [Sunxiuqinia sp. sy24]|uniref:hypothetical protein n=1 Tax=Sunxiuqinia sp. sy24 TaxID=3461495 RepID=UPI0040453CDD
MINSKYINDILNKLIETESDYDLLKAQVDLLEIKDLEYTCTGLFVHFIKPISIERFKITEDKVLDGLIIKAKEQELDAEGMLFIKNGLIDYLEIWSRSGEYPKHEIMKYELIQGWIDKN